MFEIFNSWSKEHKSIFGALRVGQNCKFSVKIPNYISYTENPVMVIFRYGFKERFLKMQETAKNGEYTEFSTEYNPTLMGIHYYYFGLINETKKVYIKKCGASCGNIGEGDLFQLTVYDDLFKTPDFIKGGVMYQIFPDRFFNSGIPKKDVPDDRIIHENWNETPLFKADQSYNFV